jgi:hypothetical protein
MMTFNEFLSGCRGNNVLVCIIYFISLLYCQKVLLIAYDWAKCVLD